MKMHTSDTLRIKRKYLFWREDSKGLSDTSADKSAASCATLLLSKISTTGSVQK
jgi:hypothetical protein